MGLLDRMAEERERAERERITREQARQQAEITAKQQAEQKREQERITLDQVTIPSYLRDTQVVIDILRALPQADYDAYFKQVEDFTRFKASAVVYASPRPTLDTDHPLGDKVVETTTQLYQALYDAHFTLPIGSQRVPLLQSYSNRLFPPTTEVPKIYTSPPKTSFADDPKEAVSIVEKYGFLSLFSRQILLDEPRVPGIGILLLQDNYNSFHIRKTNQLGYTEWGTLSIFDTKKVHLRIMPQIEALTTYATGQHRFQITSFKRFDDSLEQALKYPIHYHREDFVEDPPSVGD